MAGDAERFAAAIAAATGKRVDLGELLRRLDGESWDAKAELLARRLAECPEMAVARAA